MVGDPGAKVSQLVAKVRDELKRRDRRVLSTYRLQFNSGFTFNDATKLIDYLHELGVSHIYASPYLRARRGSVHGYDVCRHDELNPELGTDEDFETFVQRLNEFGMGHLLDFVPNHMAASAENPWWYDLLENGPNSPYSQFFDIDWQPVKFELANRVLLPFLGEQYGEALESGKLKLEYADGSFIFRYYDNVFPVGPKTVTPLLEHRLDELQANLGAESEEFVEYQSILTAIKHLPPQTATDPQLVCERQREKEVIKRRVRELYQRSEIVAEFISQNVTEFNGQVGEPASFNRLDELVCAQSYRLCHWKAASDEINYRRFFDINELAAICMEQEEVFQRSHRLVMNLLVQGKVDGLRIDHVDGLYDPTQYLWRLQWAYLEELGAVQFIELAGDSEDAAAEWVELKPLYLRAICDELNLIAPHGLAVLSAGESQNASAEAAVQEGDAPPTRPHSEPRSRLMAGSPAIPLYVLIEKILGADEPLPGDWPVAGTTGYDFLGQLNGLFLDPRGLADIHRDYERFLGVKLDFSDEVHRCKLLILRVAMSSELQMLAHRLNRISEQHRLSRDFTLNSLRHALREILACFPVYRTYPGPSGVSDRDRRFINLAVARAKRRNPAIDSAVFDFVRSVLLFENVEPLWESARRDREIFAGRFQQVTSPVMAKGVEDTAFYVVCPLLSINEVGSHPTHAAYRIDQFHQENLVRQRTFPEAMLATSTHDTKRSEDLRARLNVLTEIPHFWRKALNQWARLNRRLRTDVDGEPAPSRNDEYVFYQTLVGVWPTSEGTPDDHARLVGRLQAYMEKATREAKIRTSWINPNHQYDAAMRDFVTKTLELRRDNRFLREFRKFTESIVDWGLWTALSQLTLKLMSPGVPDIYQGQEFWNFTLVDPDNRQPVDFDWSRERLHQLKDELRAQGELSLCHRFRDNPRDPTLKLFVTWRCLTLRRAHPDLFFHGEYRPIHAEGSGAEHICAFAWHKRDADGEAASVSAEPSLIVAVPRFVAKMDLERPNRETDRYPFSDAWGDTAIHLEGPVRTPLRNLFTNQEVNLNESRILAADLFRDFPVAVIAPL